MKLICEVNEELEVITEANEDGGKNYFIEGVFMQGGVKNKNGRIYPVDVLKNEVDRYNKQYVKENRAYGELGHPTGPTINLDRVSHVIKELHQDGNNFVGKAKVMDTPSGNIVKNLMKEGCRLGVSSRGMGSLEEQADGTKLVKDDFHLATAADIVADPSAPNAFVQGIMEGREWIWNNGSLHERDVEELKRQVDVSRHLREERALLAFDKFLNSVKN